MRDAVAVSGGGIVVDGRPIGAAAAIAKRTGVRVIERPFDDSARRRNLLVRAAARTPAGRAR